MRDQLDLKGDESATLQRKLDEAHHAHKQLESEILKLKTDANGVYEEKEALSRKLFHCEELVKYLETEKGTADADLEKYLALIQSMKAELQKKIGECKVLAEEVKEGAAHLHDEKNLAEQRARELKTE